MLFILGTVAFEVWPVNVTEVSKQSEAGIVEKPVIGRRPPLEFVGDGPETVTMTVKLFPEKLGGLSAIDRLASMRLAGIPQHLMRGDGTPMGFFMVDKITEKSTYLGPNGVGRVIDIDLSLRRADAPSAGDALASIIELFG